MAQYTPLFTPGAAITYSAGEAITGGQLVEITGDRVIAPAEAGSAKVVGVAAFDAAIGDDVTVFTGGVQRPLATGAIAAGDRVAAAAAGTVTTAEEDTIGLALAAASDGALAQIKFDA